MLHSILGLLMLLLMTSVAWAHGENKPGPLGGYIRMPGAYHIELIPDHKGYKVRLLDLQFREPTVKKSTLRLTFKHGKKQQNFKCAVSLDSFYCALPGGQLPKQGQLTVSSQRLGVTGMDVTYALPLTHTGMSEHRRP